jgi:cell division protein FtsL
MTKYIRQKYISENEAPRSNSVWKRLTGKTIALQVLLLVVIVLAGFSYLFYINRTATGSFEIKSLESKVAQLQDQNKTLELQTAEMQSLGNVEEGIKDMQMVAVSHVQYLPAVGAAVAVR